MLVVDPPCCSQSQHPLPSPPTPTIIAVAATLSIPCLLLPCPCSLPALSNHSERLTLYSVSIVLLVVAAFPLLNCSRNHSCRPYLYCHYIFFFFPSSTIAALIDACCLYTHGLFWTLRLQHRAAATLLEHLHSFSSSKEQSNCGHHSRVSKY
ncbi:hypothetical protein BHE74_00057021 [Ensete ventricosum]|nr:hypothetical protein BHE74_00057021 [Ensete ventricosum]